MAKLKDLAEFGKGVARGVGTFVKPYVSLIGEAAYQGGRYLVDPTFRKAIRSPESLAIGEIEKVGEFNKAEKKSILVEVSYEDKRKILSNASRLRRIKEFLKRNFDIDDLKIK